ncbi:MAG: hypothetical protein K2K25_09875 [Muribaculaceae bacterium]|nr:hypothetical protein [Muribaculaceae bacterium]
MEEDKLKDIFKEFNPELSSSFQFMTKLQKNMEAVEIVKQYNADQKKRNKFAVTIAAACGFAMGVILTLLFPLIEDFVSNFSVSLPFLHVSNLTINFSFISWISIGALSVITALNAYDIALAKLTHTGSTS